MWEDQTFPEHRPHKYLLCSLVPSSPTGLMSSAIVRGRRDTTLNTHRSCRAAHRLLYAVCLGSLSCGSSEQNFKGLCSNISDLAWVMKYNISSNESTCTTTPRSGAFTDLGIHIYTDINYSRTADGWLTCQTWRKQGIGCMGDFCRPALTASGQVFNSRNLFSSKNVLFPNQFGFQTLTEINRNQSSEFLVPQPKRLH